MNARVQEGTRGRPSPPTPKMRELGSPKKTWIPGKLHSRVSREARIVARQTGTTSPYPRLGRTHAYAATAHNGLHAELRLRPSSLDRGDSDRLRTFGSL